MSNLTAVSDMFDVHKWFHDLVSYYGNPIMDLRNWCAIEDEYTFEIVNGNMSGLPTVKYCPICGKKLKRKKLK